VENTILITESPVFGEDYEHLGDASLETRNALLKIFTEFGLIDSLKKEIIRKAGVCLYELESNIIIHAKFGFLKTIADKDRILSIAKDIGPGITNIMLAMKPGFSTASQKARELGFGAGMGLKNVQKISDIFFITSTYGKGTYIIFEISGKELKYNDIKMKIREIIKELDLKVVTRLNEEILDKIIDKAYACDLLSNVLAKGEEDSAWITVQSNINVVGVAVIKRIPIIIVTEGNQISDETIKKAEENFLIIATTPLDTFTIAGKLYNLLKR